MPNYYRITDPTDVRNLGDQIAAWQAAGNPKANDWAEQPAAPSADAVWSGGQWVFPQTADPVSLASDHVLSEGFDADRKVILLNKLLKVKEAGNVSNYPKLGELYAWMETVQSLAVSGQIAFPPAPHTFAEVLAE